MTELLSVDAVSKRFGGLAALDAVSLSVRVGEIYGLIAGAFGRGRTIGREQYRFYLGHRALSVRLMSWGAAGSGARQGWARPPWWPSDLRPIPAGGMARGRGTQNEG